MMTGDIIEDNNSLALLRQVLFFPSEVLHSKWPSSEGGTPSGGGGHRGIVICHKDRPSFYKCTRKARRNAIRMGNDLFSSIKSTSSEVVTCDGYFVGRISSGECPSAEDDAIHKRLASEFGQSCCAMDSALPNANNLTTIKYGSGNDTRADDRCSPSERIINVVFFDVDAIADKDGSALVHLDLINTFLASPLILKDAMGSIIHFRSEALYRVVTSLCSAIPPRNGLSVIELAKCPSLLKNGSEGIVNAPIRRLRDRKAAANCPLSLFPARYVEISSPLSHHEDGDSVCKVVEICRFHNYDAERGCLRSKKARHNSVVKGCDLDHYHCHRCGEGGHRAIECPVAAAHTQRNSAIVFRKDPAGSIASFPIPFGGDHHSVPNSLLRDSTPGPPALLVLGGRLRGRTLATCEMMPLTSSSPRRWSQLPNLCSHRGSHAACSPAGSMLAFVLGGGTADGNSDAVEVLDFAKRLGRSSSSAEDEANQRDCAINNHEWQWRTIKGRLSSPRHAFGAVSCATLIRGTNDDDDGMTSVSIFAVGGWKYGAVSCESVERLSLQYNTRSAEGSSMHRFDSEWEMCAPLLIPRRLHSVVASTDGSSIYVLGGYVDERRTTSSIERYDVHADTWTAVDELPFHDNNCSLVQAVADADGGILIFPFSTEKIEEGREPPSVLRYRPGSDPPFLPAHIPKDKQEQHLRLPIANWHSFSVTRMTSLDKAFLVGGTINGKWTNRCYELDLISFEWTELPAMSCARRRLAAIVLE